MTKSDLVKKIADVHTLSKAQAERIINTLFESISDELIAGEEVQISNFGKFYVRSVAERKMRNPRTGEEGITPPHKIAAFRAFKSLKKAVNQAKE